MSIPAYQYAYIAADDLTWAPNDVLAPFSLPGYRLPMPDAPENLRPADADDVKQSLAFALRFNGRKRFHSADDYMAQIVAEHLLAHLERSGFVIMKRPPAAPYSWPPR